MRKNNELQVELDKDFDKQFLSDLNLLLTDLTNFSPFLSTLSNAMKIAGPSKSVKTAMISRRGVMVYNEKWLKSLTVGEIAFVLIHESMHPAFDYWERFSGIDGRIANKAHDHAINHIQVAMSANLTAEMKHGNKTGSRKFPITMPKNGLCDPKYKNMSAEGVALDIIQSIKEREEAIKQERIDLLNDPEKLKAYKREAEVQKLLRKSLIEAMGVIDERQDRILSKLGIVDKETVLIASKDMHILRSSSARGMTISGESFSQESSRSAGFDLGASYSSAGSAGFGEFAGFDNDSEQRLSKINAKLDETLKVFSERERERIENFLDGNSFGRSLADHLKMLGDEVDQVIDSYVEEVTKKPEPSEKNDQQNQENPDQPSDEKQPGDDGDQPGDSNEPGDGDQPDDGNQPGDGEQPGEGDKPDLSVGGKPADGDQLGEGEPGEDGQGEGNKPGASSGGQPGGSQGAGGGDVEKSITDALMDAATALGGLSKDLEGGLNGKDSSLPLDKDMLAGRDPMSKGAKEQAEEEILGADDDLEGDTLLDCSNLPGNPYKNEKPEETASRFRSVLSEAVKKDAEEGGHGWGSMPAHGKEAIEKILHPAPRFEDKMKRFAGSVGIMPRHSRMVPNKRNTFQPLTSIRPGEIPNESQPFLLIDTSGSIMQNVNLTVTKQALAFAIKLFRSKGVDMTVVQCDADVKRTMTSKELVRELKQKKFFLEGKGGSDFTQAFEEIWGKMKVDPLSTGNVILVVTDGAITVPDEPPRWVRNKQQVLWITGHNQQPPTRKWGKHIAMNPPDDRYN